MLCSTKRAFTWAASYSTVAPFSFSPNPIAPSAPGSALLNYYCTSPAFGTLYPQCLLFYKLMSQTKQLLFMSEHKVRGMNTANLIFELNSDLQSEERTRFNNFVGMHKKLFCKSRESNVQTDFATETFQTQFKGLSVLTFPFSDR